MHGNYSWYVVAHFRRGCHETGPTPLCGDGAVSQTQLSSSASDDQS